MSDQTTIEGINYGPLTALVGTWEGDKGVDRAPEPDGDEMRYSESTILDIYDKSFYDHKDVNTLHRVS
jgi:hypothetical protein